MVGARGSAASILVVDFRNQSEPGSVFRQDMVQFTAGAESKVCSFFSHQWRHVPHFSGAWRFDALKPRQKRRVCASPLHGCCGKHFTFLLIVVWGIPHLTVKIGFFAPLPTSTKSDVGRRAAGGRGAASAPQCHDLQSAGPGLLLLPGLGCRGVGGGGGVTGHQKPPCTVPFLPLCHSTCGRTPRRSISWTPFVAGMASFLQVGPCRGFGFSHFPCVRGVPFLSGFAVRGAVAAPLWIKPIPRAESITHFFGSGMPFLPAPSLSICLSVRS